jgi:hypothetical protein
MGPGSALAGAEASARDGLPRGMSRTGRAAWAPLLVLAGGLVAVPFYSFDKVVHFILLGLLWGSAWLHMALNAGRRADRPGPSSTGEAQVGIGYRPAVSRASAGDSTRSAT